MSAARLLRGPGRPIAGSPLWVGCLAAFGVFAAHVAAFRVATPDVHHRLELLEETGHGYWSVVAPLALGLLAAGLAAFIRRRASNDPGTRASFFRTAVTLSVLQVGGFLVLEAIERTVSGVSPAAVLTDRVVLIGIVLQVIAALLGALLLVALGAAVDRLVAALRTVRRSSATIPQVSARVPHLVAAPLNAGGRGLRGPPVRF